MSELAKLVNIPTHGKPSNNKNDFYLSSLIDDDPWKALPKHEKQLLQIYFDHPETILMVVSAGSKFSASKPSPRQVSGPNTANGKTTRQRLQSGGENLTLRSAMGQLRSTSAWTIVRETSIEKIFEL